VERLAKLKITRISLLVIFDTLSAALSLALSLSTRFLLDNQNIPKLYVDHAIHIFPVWLLITYVIFFLCRLYKSLWSYAGVEEAIRIFIATLMSGVIFYNLSLLEFFKIPRSCSVLATFFLFVFVFSVRFSYRTLRYIRYIWPMHIRNSDVKTEKRILLIGAGEAGNTLLREMRKDSSFQDARVVVAIDDDNRKKESYISGVRIIGGSDLIIQAVKDYHIDEIIIAMPSASSKQRKQIISICKQTECQIRTLPSIYEMLTGKRTISSLRPININDLLGREPVESNIKEMCSYINGKIVLITGAAGSIGSELCRQIAKCHPKELILLDINENAVFFLEHDLRELYPNLTITSVIGSVRDKRRLHFVFAQHKPEVVYHAAAHKHVPLMESNACEAIKNNVFGTLNVVEVAHEYETLRFVMISTDKAVNPTNIMGASKRICEMIVQTYDKRSKTEFASVRFGNVLGSNGSVVPIFQKQIEKGGPVTLTHPEIIRYFMTINEAATLVIQAGAYAKGGEIFVLDMGEPVKIMDLAENMIRLSGKKPHRDIEIQITGLRPGEKIKEELLMEEEGLQRTSNKKVFIGKPIPMDERLFFERLDKLRVAIEGEGDDIRELVCELVPTYHSNSGQPRVECEQVTTMRESSYSRVFAK
jgi:FlaA1/EpsC-like NDP-sugar epimerase